MASDSIFAGQYTTFHWLSFYYLIYLKGIVSERETERDLSSTGFLPKGLQRLEPIQCQQPGASSSRSPT